MSAVSAEQKAERRLSIDVIILISAVAWKAKVNVLITRRKNSIKYTKPRDAESPKDELRLRWIQSQKTNGGRKVGCKCL